MNTLHLTILYLWLNLFFSSQLQAPAHTESASVSVEVGDARVTGKLLLQSKDGGKTWEDLSNYLPEQVQPDAFFATESDLYLRMGNVTYHSEIHPDTPTPVWKIEDISNKDNETNWKLRNGRNVITVDGVIITTGQRGIKRSTDNGETWDWVIKEGGVGIAVEPINGGLVAISCNTTTMSRRIHISKNNGKTWKAIEDGLRQTLFITSVKQVGQYLIVGHPDGIFRTADQGETWEKVYPGIASDDPEYNPTLDNNPLTDFRSVYRIFVSGETVYAVAASAGC